MNVGGLEQGPCRGSVVAECWMLDYYTNYHLGVQRDDGIRTRLVEGGGAKNMMSQWSRPAIGMDSEA